MAVMRYYYIALLLETQLEEKTADIKSPTFSLSALFFFGTCSKAIFGFVYGYFEVVCGSFVCDAARNKTADR